MVVTATIPEGSCPNPTSNEFTFDINGQFGIGYAVDRATGVFERIASKYLHRRNL